jgi:hypothetical protein
VQALPLKSLSVTHFAPIAGSTAGARLVGDGDPGSFRLDACVLQKQRFRMRLAFSLLSGIFPPHIRASSAFCDFIIRRRVSSTPRICMLSASVQARALADMDPKRKEQDQIDTRTNAGFTRRARDAWCPEELALIPEHLRPSEEETLDLILRKKVFLVGHQR